MLYPKITIITPTLNQGQYIEETIQSIVTQNYPNLEYIIIDGCSSDNTLEIIKKYENYITFWISEKDNGQSQAINKGIKKSTGEIINWINSDDILITNSLFLIAEQFAKEAETQCVIGNYLIIDDTNTSQRFTQKVINQSLEKTSEYTIIKQPSTFYRKSAIEKMGLLNEQLHYTMDFEWWLKYLALFDIYNVTEIENNIAGFRVHNNSKTFLFIERFEKEIDTIYRNIYNFIQNDASNSFAVSGCEKYKKKLAQIYNSHFIALAIDCYSKRNFNLSKYYLQQLINSYLLENEISRISNISTRMNYYPKWIYSIIDKIRK